MAQLYQKILEWLLPYTCILCGDHSNIQRDLCLPCTLDLPWMKQSCYQCGNTFLKIDKESHCMDCLIDPPPYQHTTALFYYDPPISNLITQLKFKHKLINAAILGKLLAEVLEQTYQDNDKPEIIIPMPLHRLRLQERGFNQAVEIARPISKRLQIPLARHFCQRRKETLPQAQIPIKERYANMKNAFVVTSNIKIKHVAILDDVVTTGQTVRELSQCLREHGVEKISVWCVAKPFYSG